MVTAHSGEIVIDSKRYQLQTPTSFQQQPAKRSPRKLGIGESTYADYDLWNEHAWTTWHLGRGEEYFETDGRFWDQWNAETRIRGQLTLGPCSFPTDVSTLTRRYQKGTRGRRWLGDPTTALYAWAESFTAPTGDLTADYAHFMIKKVGTPGSGVTVSLCADDNGSPNATPLKTKLVAAADIPKWVWTWIKFDWTGTTSLTGGGTYWLVVGVSALSSTSRHGYKVRVDSDAGYSGTCKSSDANAWSWTTKAGFDLWFRIAGAEADLSGKPVAMCIFDDNGTDKLALLAGSEVYLWNPTNDRWDNDTAGLSGDGTDMLAWNDSLIVAQSTDGNIREKTGGSWGDYSPTREARILGLGICPRGALEGTMVLIATDATSRNKLRVIKNNGTAWKNLKSNAADMIVGDAMGNITWAGMYDASVWIGKTTGLWQVGQDGQAYEKFPFATQRAAWNFKGACVWHNNELMLPVQYGLWSFDGRTLKNIGPGVGLVHRGRQSIRAGTTVGDKWGLAGERQGKIKALLPTVNVLYAAIDGGTGNYYSSVILWTGRGWHEAIRGDGKGVEIQALAFTPAGTPETKARLWYGYGKDVFYVELPDTTDDAFQWASSTFELQGLVDFAWFDAGLKGIDKDWGSVIVEAEGVTETETVEILYKLDDDTAWTSLGLIDDGTSGTAISNNQAKLSFGTSTYGKRIRLRVYLESDNDDLTPKVTGIILKYWKTPDIVWAWNFSLKLTDDSDRSWRVQKSDFITTYEKKEPITLVDPDGASKTVKLDQFAGTYLMSETGQPKGYLITCWAYTA